MAGKAAKTNLGGSLQRNDLSINAGNPSLSDSRQIAGTITDIRLPGEFYKREGSGILVQVTFDQKEHRTDAWLPLKDDYQYIRTVIGNRMAILKTALRVSYHFNSLYPEDGYCELICDNKQERSFDEYERNPSSSYIGIISGLALGTPPLG